MQPKNGWTTNCSIKIVPSEGILWTPKSKYTLKYMNIAGDMIDSIKFITQNSSRGPNKFAVLLLKHAQPLQLYIIQFDFN